MNFDNVIETCVVICIAFINVINAPLVYF